MASGIYDFIFYNLLKYDHASSVLTGELQHDIIFGLMIPTIFIAIVLLTAVNKIFGESHKVIGYLSSITGLGVIITLGWVPLIAGIGGFVFVILIALYFLAAFYRRIVPHGHEKAVVDAAGWAGSKIDLGNVTLTEKDMRKLGTELRIFDEEYNTAEAFIHRISQDSKNKGISVNLINHPENLEKLDERTRSEFRMQMTIKSNAITEGEKIVGKVRRDQRKKFIGKYTEDDKKYQEELLKLYEYMEKVKTE